MLWEEGGGAPEALGRLLGATRAALLQQLDAPVSTTELARRLEMAAGGVSMHLRALRDAGLLTAERHGREVLYVRTELADELVAAA
jgi:DNA-binding transcriptional ArsR family regulator